MQIANPIYDVVFKYLMDDNRIARMLISKIIGDEIESLSFQPLENKVDLERQTITIYRLDFSAIIKTDKGESKNVIIEIQKAKFPTDIMRFRKYLGQQYINDRNAEIIDERKVAIPIISIYFLGHGLDHTEAPVIKVNRNYIDVSTGDEIQEKEAFIESLTHDSYVIQIPHLKNRRRNDLEILLSVFDQSNIDKDHHIMNINEDNFPEKYRSIIRRLQRAVAEPQVRKTMDIEDEVLEELENKERAIFKRDEIIKQKDKKLEEKDKKLEEKDRIIEDLQKKLIGK